MIWDILFVAFISIPAMFVAVLYGIFFGDNAKIGTALILVLIEFVLLAILQFKVILPFCIDLGYEEVSIGRNWTYIINVIILIVLCISSFGAMAEKAIICPHCGAWNEYRFLKQISSESYDVWETVERDIKNKNGDTIGTYDSRELRTCHESSEILICKKCKKEFTHTSKYTTDK
jgi:hypothetical protein